MSDLKPCPFCGEDEQEALVVTSKVVQPVISAQIECLNCSARGPLHFDGEGPQSASDGARFVWDNERVGNARAAPKVKPLEWRNGPASKEFDWVDTELGQYMVYETAFGFDVKLSGFAVAINRKSFDEAKAAAQADYERRILSALETET